MRVKFDYLTGPVLGHRRRCEILHSILSKRDHVLINDDTFDWMVYDHPESPPPASPRKFQRRLVMGQLPVADTDYAWMPTHESHERTLTGKEYLILDPQLSWYKNMLLSIRPNLLITMGGADPYCITEKLALLLAEHDATVIIGSGFNRDIQLPQNWYSLSRLTYNHMLAQLAASKKVIATWGQTVFELMYLQKPFIAIATQPEHLREAEYLGLPCLAMDELRYVPALLSELRGHDHGLDLLGAQRVAEFMERPCLL